MPRIHLYLELLTPVTPTDLFFICSPEVKPHTGDGNGKGKGVGRDAADGEWETSQGVRH